MKIQTFSPTIRRKEMDAVLTCMVAEKVGPGDINAKLIQQIKETFGVDGAAALRSPALALKYCVKALGLSPGDGIMLSALAPEWQFAAAEELGLVPVVLDTDAESAQLTVQAVGEGIRKGGRLLLLHESMGILPDITGMLALGIPVVEDISQSAGAAFGPEDARKKAGTFGVFSILGLEETDMLTAGGGAVLMAPARREWIVLKKLTDEAPSTDILPDINCALALVQVKEMARNEALRREMQTLYAQSLMQSRHKTLIQTGSDAVNVVYSFPVVLSSGYKEVKQYAARKEIDIVPAFENSIIAAKEDELPECVNAKSLFLRCVLFPLYPRLGNSHAVKIAKVLATLP